MRFCVGGGGGLLYFEVLRAAPNGNTPNMTTMRWTFRKFSRNEDEVAEGQWRRVVELRIQFVVAMNMPKITIQSRSTYYCNFGCKLSVLSFSSKTLATARFDYSSMLVRRSFVHKPVLTAKLPNLNAIVQRIPASGMCLLAGVLRADCRAVLPETTQVGSCKS